MPIVDGLTSTKMIRSFEKSHPANILSPRASLNGRIPIIAVSASLEESKRQSYIDAGFDAWILKPISFPRLQELMTGIVDPKVREEALFTPGEWERGGWFEKSQHDLFQASTKPSERAPTDDATQELREAACSGNFDVDDGESRQTEEQSRLSKSTPDLGKTSRTGSDEGSGSLGAITGTDPE